MQGSGYAFGSFVLSGFCVGSLAEKKALFRGQRNVEPLKWGRAQPSHPTLLHVQPCLEDKLYDWNSTMLFKLVFWQGRGRVKCKQEAHCNFHASNTSPFS